MKILIAGNGFDLEHGLPTRYTDFLEMVKAFKAGSGANELGAALRRCGMEGEFGAIVADNAWLDFFFRKYTPNKSGNANWVDFEREIGAVINALEQDVIKDNCIMVGRKIFPIKESLFDRFYKKFPGFNPARRSGDFTVNMRLSGEALERLVEFLYEELRRFSRAFEMYCVAYVMERGE